MNETFFSILGGCKGCSSKPARDKRGSLRPEYRFRFANDWSFQRESKPSISLARDFSKIRFSVDFAALAKQAGRPMTALEVDLGWVALAVYFADRTAPRSPYGNNGPIFWRRRIHVEVPVSDDAHWRAISDSLSFVLEYLTEDDWSFEFLPGRRRCDAETQGHFSKMRPPPISWTALFSGGLDSTAGGIRWLKSVPGVGLLVSGQTHARIALGQNDLVAGLREHFPQRVEHVGVDYGIPDKSGLTGFESSQRTRAFVHTALGALSALMAKNRQLFLFENGFGALNLPCDSAQLGSQNSKGTHPVFLQRMSAFVRAVFNRPFVIANPFNYVTKAEMLSADGMKEFKDLFHMSFSCDRFPNYHHKSRQCGCCASCLVRRLAFHGADIAEDEQTYTCNVLNPRRSMHESEMVALTKLTIQGENLSTALSVENPWLALCERWPGLARMELEFGSKSARDATIALLARHVAEWKSFLGSVPAASFKLAA